MEKTDKIINTAIIGLGGTGIDIINSLRMLLVKEFGSLQSLNKKIAFLAIDTDKGFSPRNQPIRYMGLDISLGEHEKHQLVVDAGEKAIIKERGYDKLIPPEAPDFDKNIFSEGAGGNRSFGRLAFFMHASRLKKRFDEVISTVRQGTNQYNVILLTSLMGGTGSGTFVDACYLAGHCVDSEKYYPILYAIIGYPCDGKFDIGESRKINVFSALTELEFFNSKENIFEANYDGLEIKSSELPTRFTYLVNHINYAGNPIYGEKMGVELYDKIAQHIYYTQIFQESANKIISLRRDYKAKLQDSPLGFSQKYLAFGTSLLEIPIEKICEAYICRTTAEIIREGLQKSDKESFLITHILTDIKNILSIQFPEERFRTVHKQMEDEEKKEREKPLVRNDIKNYLKDFVYELENKYGSAAKQNPEYLESNRRDILTRLDIINGIYLSRVESIVKKFLSEDKFKTGFEFLDTAIKELDKQIVDFDRLRQDYTKDRDKNYNDTSTKIKVIRDEIKVPLADLKWHIDELKKITQKYYKISADVIEYTIALEVLRKIKKRAEERKRELERETLPTLSEESEKLLGKYEAVKKEAQKEYEINIDDNFTSEFKDSLQEKISRTFDISNTAVDISVENILNNYEIRIAGINRLREIFTIDKYVDNLQRNLHKDIKTIIADREEDASLLLQLTGETLKSLVKGKDDSKDSLRFCFAPIQDIKIKSETKEFRNKENVLTEPQRIIFVKEEAGFPLNCISFFNSYKKNYEQGYRSAHTVRDIFDNYLDKKLKRKEIDINTSIEESAVSERKGTSEESSQLAVPAKRIELNNFQLLQIGRALEIIEINKDGHIQTIYDQFGIEVSFFDEMGIPLSEDKKLKILNERIQSELNNNQSVISNKIIEYMKLADKSNARLYSQLYKELIDDFLKKL